MTLLPAAVPEVPAARSEVVPARLAQNVAPLFGVPWPDGPFGQRTWVSDFSRITLSEVARGAPLPTRTQTREHPPESETTWQLVDRIAIAGRRSSLPHEIANATLNRFGPDTRAAVLLTAANRLLTPVTTAIDEALGLLTTADGRPLPLELGLAAWAGLVLETFRSQPALVAAAIRARAIQRELVDPWNLPLVEPAGRVPLTRCEIGSSEQPMATDRPRTLDVADRTMDRLGDPLDDALREPSDAVTDEDPFGIRPAERDRRANLVSLLLRNLLVLGTADDASHLWLSERSPDMLVVEALVPPTGLINRFVRQAVPTPQRSPQLPVVPSAAAVAGLSPLGRRAVFLALLTVLRQVQHSPQQRDSTRPDVLATLAEIAVRVRETLPADDPMAALARCRVADMTVQTLRPDATQDLRAPLAELRAALRTVQRLGRAGVIDRGAAAEAISSGNVELNAVRWFNALVPGSGLPDPGELDAELRESWRCYHEMLQIKPDAVGRDTERTVGFHLQNYAAFLSRSADPADLDEAVRLFAEVVIPARTSFHERTESFRPLRNALQVASRATTRLAEAALERGHRTSAEHYARLGLGWIRRALAGDEARALLAVPTERTVRLALLAAPALLVAVEVGGVGATAADLQTADRLLDLVAEWERQVRAAGGEPARHAELVALRKRLSLLT